MGANKQYDRPVSNLEEFLGLTFLANRRYNANEVNMNLRQVGREGIVNFYTIEYTLKEQQPRKTIQRIFEEHISIDYDDQETIEELFGDKVNSLSDKIKKMFLIYEKPITTNKKYQSAKITIA
jgi:hypothetical protein